METKKNGFTSWEMSEFTRIYTWIIFCLLENVQGFIWLRNWCLCYIRLGCSSMSLVDNFKDVSSFMHISRHYKFSNLISFSPSIKRVYWLFPKRCQNVIVNFWMKSDQSLIRSHQELRHKVFIYILSNTSQLNTRTHEQRESKANLFLLYKIALMSHSQGNQVVPYLLYWSTDPIQ